MLHPNEEVVAKARGRALDVARKLSKRAYQEVPEKSKAQVLLECARLEEFATPGDPATARYILQRACKEVRDVCVHVGTHYAELHVRFASEPW